MYYLIIQTHYTLRKVRTPLGNVKATPKNPPSAFTIHIFKVTQFPNFSRVYILSRNDNPKLNTIELFDITGHDNLHYNQMYNHY